MLTHSYSKDFTVPNSITVIKVTGDGRIKYIGVSSGKRYNLVMNYKYTDFDNYTNEEWRLSNKNTNREWMYIVSRIGAHPVKFDWSPEINKQTPNVKDY